MCLILNKCSRHQTCCRKVFSFYLIFPKFYFYKSKVINGYGTSTFKIINFKIYVMYRDVLWHYSGVKVQIPTEHLAIITFKKNAVY